MNIADNVIKAHLKNVYFLAGTACGGKTTASRLLAARHGFALYDGDNMFDSHAAIADPEHQPSMTRRFADMTEFFGRPPEEYARWLTDNAREQTDMALIDLMELGARGPVVADMHIDPGIARRIIAPERIVYMIAPPDVVVRDYYDRPDKKGLTDCLMALPDAERLRANCSATLMLVNGGIYRAARASGLCCIERDDERAPEQTLALVERHFGLI